jgi:hypothetical protein
MWCGPCLVCLSAVLPTFEREAGTVHTLGENQPSKDTRSIERRFFVDAAIIND